MIIKGWDRVFQSTQHRQSAATRRPRRSPRSQTHRFNPRSTVKVLRPEGSGKVRGKLLGFNPRSTVKVLRLAQQEESMGINLVSIHAAPSKCCDLTMTSISCAPLTSFNPRSTVKVLRPGKAQ